VKNLDNLFKQGFVNNSETLYIILFSWMPLQMFHTKKRVRRHSMCEHYWIIQCSIKGFTFVDSFTKGGIKLLQEF